MIEGIFLTGLRLYGGDSSLLKYYLGTKAIRSGDIVTVYCQGNPSIRSSYFVNEGKLQRSGNDSSPEDIDDVLRPGFRWECKV